MTQESQAQETGENKADGPDTNGGKEGKLGTGFSRRANPSDTDDPKGPKNGTGFG